jgi:hypothetical protein
MTDWLLALAFMVPVLLAWGPVAGIVVCCLAEGPAWGAVKRESLAESPVLTLALAVVASLPLGLWISWGRLDALGTWGWATAAFVAVGLWFCVRELLDRRDWPRVAQRARRLAAHAQATGCDPRPFLVVATGAEQHHGLLRDWKRDLRDLERQMSTTS